MAYQEYHDPSNLYSLFIDSALASRSTCRRPTGCACGRAKKRVGDVSTGVQTPSRILSLRLDADDPLKGGVSWRDGAFRTITAPVGLPHADNQRLNVRSSWEAGVGHDNLFDDRPQ